MAKMKATRKGTCQVCGRGQKLPAGNLSTHGYTVDWGYFNGTCPGTGAEPLETSRALLDSAMLGLEAEAERLDTAAPATIICRPAYVPRRVYGRQGNRPATDGSVENTIEAFRALAEANRDSWVSHGFYTVAGADTVAVEYDKAVDVARAAMVRRAAGMRAHVAEMRALAGAVHGKPLELIAK